MASEKATIILKALPKLKLFFEEDCPKTKAVEEEQWKGIFGGYKAATSWFAEPKG